MSDSNRLLLYCHAVTGEDEEVSRSAFQQEQGKKSSFLLSEPLSIPQPAHLTVHCGGAASQKAQQFFLGGFQLVSNAKQVEIYATDEEGKETYLMTSKGIQSQKGENGEEWQKAVCVVPGGPRPVLQLKIKLLSLKPNDTSEAIVQSLKLTARLPEASATTTTTQKASQPQMSDTHMPLRMTNSEGSPSSGNHGSSPTPGGITHADLGAALATMSIVARTTESSIESSTMEQFQRLDRMMQQRFSVLEHHMVALTSVLSSQQNTLQRQTKMIESQQQLIMIQSKQIEQLVNHQNQVASKIVEKESDNVYSLEEKNEITSTPGINVDKAKEEEPIERGIEQTLSNLEPEEDEAEKLLESAKPDTAEVIDTASTCPTVMDDHGTTVPEPVEQIEVSLSGINHVQHVVTKHLQEEGADAQRSLQLSPLNDALSTGDGLRNPTRSYEDRNDKSEVTEAEAVCSNNVQLEVLAFDEDRTIEVLESTTADEHERSPPDVADTTFFDL